MIMWIATEEDLIRSTSLAENGSACDDFFCTDFQKDLDRLVSGKAPQCSGLAKIDAYREYEKVAYLR